MGHFKDDFLVTGVKRKEGLPPAPSVEEKKVRQSSPQPPLTANDHYKREPIVLEASKNQVVRAGGSVVLEVEWQCHSSTIIEWFRWVTLWPVTVCPVQRWGTDKRRVKLFTELRWPSLPAEDIQPDRGADRPLQMPRQRRTRRGPVQLYGHSRPRR